MKFDIAELREPMRIVYDIQGKGILRSPGYVEINNPSLEQLFAVISLLDGEKQRKYPWRVKMLANA